MVLYLPVKEQLHQAELGDYISYGIAAWKLPALTRKPCAFVSDVSLDKKQAARLSWRCTVGQLDPRQLMDVVEDFI